MANIDYSMQKQLDPTAIASLLATASQRNTENQLSAQQQQEKQQNDTFDHTMQVTKLASDLTSSMMSQQAERQMKQSQQHLMSILPPQQQSLFASNPAEATKLIQEKTFKPVDVSYETKDAMIKNPNGELTPVRYVVNPKEGIPRDMTPQHNSIKGEVVPVPSVFNQDVVLTDADRKNPDLMKLGHAIASGHATPSQLANLRTANGQKAVKMALEENPNLDITSVAQRGKVRTDFTPGGKAGMALGAFNTAIIHSDKLHDQVDALNNSDFKKYNTVANIIKNESGRPEVKLLENTRNAFANEAAKAIRGGSGVITEEEVKRELDSFDSANSPAQLKAVTENMVQLMADKAGVLKAQWENALPGETPASPFVTPRAGTILKKYKINPDTLLKETNNSSKGGNLADALRAVLPKR